MPRVLITRSPHQASALAEALRPHGITPILIPTIELAPPTTFAPLDAALANLDHFHWLLFTSANAVEAFAQRLAVLKGTGFSPSVRPPEGVGALAPQSSSTPYSLIHIPCRVAAIGPATAAALQLIGIKPNLIPPQAVAESLAEALLPHTLQPDGSPTRFLIVRAEEARNTLETHLKRAGSDVTIAPAYKTIIPATSIPAIRELFITDPPDAITFTSSSTAINLIALLAAANLTLPPAILRISIGPITSQTLRSLNLPPHAEALQPSIPSLAEKVLEVLRLN